MKGMGAFSFADVVLRNSVLGTFRCYDQDKDEEESEYKIFSWDNIERAQACVILAWKTWYRRYFSAGFCKNVVVSN